MKPTTPRKSVQAVIKKNPVIGRRLRTELKDFVGFSYLQKVKYRRAARKVEVMVNSLEFKNFVMGNKFTSTTLPNDQIYNRIMTGHEEVDPKVDYRIDIQVEIYYENSDTIGFMYEGSAWTFINDFFFKTYTDGEVAANIFHEWLHQAGFMHDHDQDYDSVPYKLGYLMEYMIGEYDNGRLKPTDLYPIKRRPKKVAA